MAGDLGQLKSVDWDKLQRYADRLESAWQNVAEGQAGPDLQQYLPLAGDPLRLVVLHELVKTEIEIRWRRGLPTSLDHYLERLPELGKAQDLPAALVYEEFRVRQQHGDKPPLAAYKVRFPNQFAELEKLQNEDPRPTAALPPAGDQPTPPMSKVVAEVKREATVTPQSTIASGGTVLPGGYKLIKRIGSGTFGEVWRADAPGGVPVAVKIVIRPVDADEAQRELHAMELIKLLQHPYLLQTHRFEIFEDRLYIVMELADGSLRDRLKQRRKEAKGGIPVGELLRYFRESAEALDFLHGEKVLHRDIKPENILLLKGHAKVADFGLARGQGSGQSMFSATGCGTPAYMAPEVWRGKVSAHTDQYSLAVAYAELRLDRRLFAGGDFMAVMMSHLEKTPDLAPLSEAEQKVLFKSMNKEPAQRYPTCMAWAEALEDALAPELGRSTLQGRQPSPSVQELRASDPSGLLGTVGRGNLPSRQGSSGDKTEQWRGGEKPRSFVRSVLLLLTVFVPLGLAGWYFLPYLRTNNTSITTTLGLRDLQNIELRAGESKRIRVNIDRAGIQDQLKMSFPNLPAGLSHDEPTIHSDKGFADLSLIAKADVEPAKNKTVTVRVDCGDLHDTKTFDVTILPLETLPAGCIRADKANVVSVAGKNYYSRIEAVRGTTSIPFLLVPSSGNPGTFYIMEDKVWVGLYRQFAKDQPKAVTSNRWEEEAKKWEDELRKNQKPADVERYPVLGTLVEDADRFAIWLGGRLPSALEWDKAAGKLDVKPRPGPYIPPWDEKAVPPQVALLKPLPVGQASRDISPYLCRDMSGNGFEWTRDTFGGQQVPLPSGDSRVDVRVWLRGWSFENGKPYEFKDRLQEDNYLNPVEFVGIRVVIPR